MSSIEEARRKLDWALRRRGVAVQAEIDSGFLNTYESLVKFTKGDKECVVAISLDWVDDCDPDSDYITPELHGLLGDVEGQLA